jgi:hypothetical protein
MLLGDLALKGAKFHAQVKKQGDMQDLSLALLNPLTQLPGK